MSDAQDRKSPAQSLPDRLVARMKAIPDGEISAAARKAGISLPVFLRLRRGENSNVTLRTLERILRGLDEDVRFGPPPEVVTRIVPPGEESLVHLTRKDAQIGAGPGYVDKLDANEAREYAFSREWITRHLGLSNPHDDDKRLGVFKVARIFGDSMEPTIRPGDVLLADLGARGEGHRKVEDGKIYVIRTPGEGGLQVKRAAIKPRRAELVVWGDNRAYPPEAIPLEGREVPQIVIGRVRWIGHQED